MSREKKNIAVMRYAGLATQWLVLLGVSVWGGIRLDAMTGWAFPLFTILLPLAALCISLWLLVRSLNKPDP